MSRTLAAALLCASLVACSAAQINAAATQIQSLCAEAAPLVPLSGPMAIWITGSCTADSMVKLATDPNGQGWLNQVIGKAKAYAGI